MTIKDISKNLSYLGGVINGREYTQYGLERFLRKQLSKAIKWDKLRYRISLPDGEWSFWVLKYSDKADGYDYWIPETRELERRYGGR